MHITNDKNIHKVKTDSYEIHTSLDRIDFLVAGEAVAGLRPVSSVSKCSPEKEVIVENESKEITLSVTEENGVPTYIWTSSSDLWEKKEYIIRCYDDRFEYSVRLTGEGDIDTISYFSGDFNEPYPGSVYEFDTYFTPMASWNGINQYHFSSMEDMDDYSRFMVPPMFVYSCTTCGISDKAVFALAADKGEHNFTHFYYKTTAHHPTHQNRFRFWIDPHGHMTVNGIWESPRVLCYTAKDDLGALKFYSDYYFDSGIARPKDPAEKKPRFWHGPIACGWIEQAAYQFNYENDTDVIHHANEKVYRNFVGELERREFHPKLLIIDDKWQQTYGNQIPDKSKFPDLRGFIDEMRKKHGIYTMLWFKLWDAEGLPEDECVWDERCGGYVCDPSNPKYRARLRDILHTLISDDDGCANAYGLKLDFAPLQPMGRKAITHSGQFGVELMLELIRFIHDTVKEIKPEAIINASPCHPLFTEYCDHARLNDYYPYLRHCFEEMKTRTEFYEAAMPGVLIDTDGAAFSTYRDTVRFMKLAPTLGIPDLYCVSPMPCLEITDEDWASVANIWREYSAEMDKRYE